ncbi:MAG: hypothetical protein J5J00_01240 [Deltaproteobacteria bacterium]|nr:hypothetical protein [Deltaproteobacteria bacterium]
MLKVLAPAAFLALTLQVCAPAESQAQTPEPSPSNFKVDASLRSRYELVDWFGPYTADRRYGFGHTKAQAGISYNAAPFRFYLQGQHFQLYDLPSSAAGPGAAYFVSHNSESEPGSAAFRQGYAEYKNQGYELYAGRFLYSNGMEVAPMNTALATLRAKRIAQRVIGPFDFTAGRSFDGARAAAGGVSGTLHTFFVMPTEGGFDSDLNQTIDEIKLAGLSWTATFS